MKAIVIRAPYDVAIEERDVPRVTQSNEVLIGIRAAGICGSDMMTFTGSSPSAKGLYPRIPGHEFVGEVVETGEGVSAVKIGDRVAVEPITYCGECYPCRIGRHNICTSVKNAGAHIDGAMKEFFLTTEDKLYKLPDRVTFKQAALIEPFTIGAQVTDRADVKSGDFVLIHGAGPIGLVVMKVAKCKGATCIVSEISEKRIEFAMRFGADYTINPLKDDLRDCINDVTGGRGPDVVIDAAGLPNAISQAVDMAARGGTLVNICFNDASMSIDIEKLIEKDLAIVGSRLQKNRFQEVIDRYLDAIIDMEELITDTFPLEKGVAAFELFKQRKEGTGKILILNEAGN
jgi:L-gulonate 5-dehydrogenase